MTAARTAATGTTATGTAAMAGIEPVTTAVPFLEIPLFIVTIGGTPGVMTPQALIFLLTGVLSLLAILKSLFKKEVAK